MLEAQLVRYRYLDPSAVRVWSDYFLLVSEETCPWRGPSAVAGAREADDDSDKTAIEAFSDMFDKIENFA